MKNAGKHKIQMIFKPQKALAAASGIQAIANRHNYNHSTVARIIIFRRLKNSRWEVGGGFKKHNRQIAGKYPH